MSDRERVRSDASRHLGLARARQLGREPILLRVMPCWAGSLMGPLRVRSATGSCDWSKAKDQVGSPSRYRAAEHRRRFRAVLDTFA